MNRLGQVICLLTPIVFIPLTSFSQENRISGGKKLFHQHCTACHGENGIGQDPKNPAGGWEEGGKRIAPALNSEGHAWHHSPELLFSYIKDGSIDETSPMPSFGGILKDTEIELIVLYVESLWSEEIQKKHKERFGDHSHIFQ
jgi:mono/diheme cytochrome c family protein